MLTSGRRRLGEVVCLLLVISCLNGWAQEGHGFKYNNLSVSPFVNLEYAYDSNVNYTKNEIDDTILRINPGVDLSYKGNNWGLTGNGWYAYDDYSSENKLDAKRYGERVDFYCQSEKGWRFVFGESYLESDQQDSLVEGGRGLWRDRNQLTLQSALSYQLSEKTSLTLSGMYSDLNYKRDALQYQPLYGWEEWSAGLEFAYKLTEKSNLLLNGGYQNYTSDGAYGISSESTGYSFMAGFGSSATKKITYRALTGLSMFDYAGGDQLYGWTYSLDASWIVNRKVAVTVAGSSYFQPSEREQNQAGEVYAMSAGVTYRPMKKLTTRFDLGYRREENQYEASSGVPPAKEDRFEARTRADYQLMRYVTLYAALEYYQEFSTEASYEFERYRGTMGVNLRY